MNVNRDFYLNKLISKMHNNKIKILTGIRRCGKSYLLFNLFKEYLISQNINTKQIITISLEDIENIELRNPIKLNNFIKSKIENNQQYYAFIDEIQMCSGIKKTICWKWWSNNICWYFVSINENKKSWYIHNRKQLKNVIFTSFNTI
ncbi:ATP-binding protein [Mycoplasmopsis felis]|uniref:ATP-binding protein n=1 Tax=Mycoplasmopsis felis TaxID=33923 RepID=UPI002AFE2899|nr:AAA family ATPase [Mycoplasmopsis felis]WQQ03213.1 AAA family ATPase [Mycoplasmopsis felis]